MIVSTALAKMLVLLVDRIGSNSNWRFYSYLDDMKSDALFQLVRSNTSVRLGQPLDIRPNILKFDTAYAERTGKPPNPFAYATQIVTNVFRRAVKIEAALANFRDDMREEVGVLPSSRRQLSNDVNRSAEPIPKPVPPRRRKKAD